MLLLSRNLWQVASFILEIVRALRNGLRRDYNDIKENT